MKFSFTIFAFLFCVTSIAQSFNLATYKKSQYENDTIYTYQGDFPNSGIGSVKLGGSLASKFITGVNFKIVLDSTNKRSAQGHTFFRDSAGTLVPVYQGDTILIPASFKLYAGNIGFHIIIEGTPQIAGESYLCDLGYAATTGNNWNLIISENTASHCTVDQLSRLNQIITPQNVKVFPNPFKYNTTIEFENHNKEPCTFILQNLLGEKVEIITNIRSNKFLIEKKGLPKGTYIFKLQKEHGLIDTGKLIIE